MTPAKTDMPNDWPRIRTVAVDGMLVSFGERLSEPANRAALTFHRFRSEGETAFVLHPGDEAVGAEARARKQRETLCAQRQPLVCDPHDMRDPLAYH